MTVSAAFPGRRCFLTAFPARERGRLGWMDISDQGRPLHSFGASGGPHSVADILQHRCPNRRRWTAKKHGHDNQSIFLTIAVDRPAMAR
ncbi:hypothetical protein ZHAS_00011194 [Anopheles sinensis]|uniref:Uncharacterized protein n=1 Tax=Anopheles sinensis TaxID=74873 RepID=A0A084VZK4_ANOSI|nr:hypothetical protein ZHAS_00011194 [Anopheles sinensis]